MSKRILTKVAGGVALGGAALLLSAPATALADTPAEVDAETTKHQKSDKRDHKKHKRGERGHDRDAIKFHVKDRHGEVYQCGILQQESEADATSIIGDVDLSGSSNAIVAVIPITPALSGNLADVGLVVCIRDIDVEVDITDLDFESILPLGNGVTPAAASLNGTGFGSPLGWLDTLFSGGVHVTEDGIIVGGSGAGNGNGNGNGVTPLGGVAAGDGGALSATNAGTMAAAGAGVLGAAALGGLGLLRRRSADDTVA